MLANHLFNYSLVFPNPFVIPAFQFPVWTTWKQKVAAIPLYGDNLSFQRTAERLMC